jgi:uncharacterized lipoprotein YajG
MVKYLLILLLAGCATQPEIRVVKPPVPPVIVVPDKPVIPKDAAQSDKLKAIAEYVLELRTRLEQAIEALNVYR